MSFDDYVITSLVAGTGSSTLPVVVYGMVRRNVEPTVNAISTLILLGTSLLIWLAFRLTRGTRRGARLTTIARRAFLAGAPGADSSPRRRAAPRCAAAGRARPRPPRRQRRARAPRARAQHLQLVRLHRPRGHPRFREGIRGRVTYDTYESSEEMVAKLQAGATGYDLVVPTTYAVTALIETGLFQTRMAGRRYHRTAIRKVAWVGSRLARRHPRDQTRMAGWNAP